mmetsp:Transcript_28098/g.47632  ORF Transcript_28098/g.47632 Transcript_28098/m.47632 type:complete len:645 (-) Transcript_28098:1380-3314(-)
MKSRVLSPCRDIDYYEAHEQDIRLEDITSDDINAEILRMLRYDDWNDLVNLINLSRERTNFGDSSRFAIRENDDCGWLGYFIGKSQKLEMMFFDYFLGRERIDALMVGLCCNQSIQRIQVDRDIGEAGFRGLGNFLGNNQSVKHMNFYSFDIGSECAQNIASMFGQCQYTSLKHIEICENNLHDEEFAQIAAALAVQPQIEELVLCDNIIGRLGCIALGSTLKSWRAPSLKKLYISIRDIDDECIQVMAAGMINCSSLSELNLSGRYLTGEVGLRSFADVFQSESCCMEKLCLSEMSIGFDGASALAAGFSRCSSLKSLNLSHNILGDAGLDAIVAGLANSSNLEELLLSSNGTFSSTGLGSLATLFRTAENLKELSLANNGINDEGLQALSAGMRNRCNVSKLNLSNNTITDVGLQALVSGLINNSKLENLQLSGHRSITVAGLRSLSAFFQSESCALKTIWLVDMSIGDDGASALADALVGNKSLKELRLSCNTSGITALGWSAFSKLLCDTSSVNNTYLSNHTLELIGRWNNGGTPPDIRRYLLWHRYLEMKQRFVTQVAMVKVIMSHPHLKMEPFFPWRLKFLPLVVACFDKVKFIFGRSETGQDLSIVYQFVRGMPLFVVRSYAGENAHRKRKRDEREA